MTSWAPVEAKKVWLFQLAFLGLLVGVKKLKQGTLLYSWCLLFTSYSGFKGKITKIFIFSLTMHAEGDDQSMLKVVIKAWWRWWSVWAEGGDWRKLKVLIWVSWRWWSEHAEDGDQRMLKVGIRACLRWWSEHAEGGDQSRLKVVIRACWRWWFE